VLVRRMMNMKRYVLFAWLAAAFVPVAAMGQECRRGVLTENGVGIAVRLLGYDDEWEAPSPIYEKNGRFYLKAVPGASYGIELRGFGRRRHEFVCRFCGNLY
jgi:hypothetical protein